MALKIMIISIVLLLVFLNITLYEIEDKLDKIMKVYDIDRLYYLKTKDKTHNILGEERDE